jgi:hypothetical protein
VINPGPRLDLLETRRQLVAMRSLHSHNRRVVIEINKLIGKIAHLHRPDNRTHEKHLTKMIAQTWRAVERILSQEPASACSWSVPTTEMPSAPEPYPVVKVVLGANVGTTAGTKAIEAKSIKKITTLRKEPPQKLLI